MCGHLPILFAKYVSKRFLWLMTMIGLPIGESLLGFEESGGTPPLPLKEGRSRRIWVFEKRVYKSNVASQRLCAHRLQSFSHFVCAAPFVLVLFGCF
jgi:hypothetical protein